MVSQEYLELIPRLAEIDRQKLLESIKKDGQLIAITVNPEGIVLDGHTRLEICKELGITPKYKIKEFSDKDDEMRFVVMTNLARRQLTKFQKVEMAWPLYQLEKKRAEERIKTQGGPNYKGVKMRYGLKKEGTAAEIFGKKMGFGKSFVNQIQYLKQNAPDSILEDLRTGNMSTVMAFDLVRGLKMIPDGICPEKPIPFCPDCNTKTTSPKIKKCHVHKWFCCSHCRWGV